MNVLWITNIVFPEALSLLTGKGSLKASGGWMLGSAEELVRQEGVKLSVASLSPKVKELTCLEGEKITYYILPLGKGNFRINHDYEPLWKEVREKVKPDVVHIHGTEYTHGLAYLEACGADNVCVSIQGLLNACYYYYQYGLTQSEIRKATTLASLIRGGIRKNSIDFKKRGECEKEVIEKVHHIIGRTSWDRDRTWATNPDAEYYHGGETLRSVFYLGPTWQYDQCIPHSIFLSQAAMPLKGLHQLLKAMPLVLRHYPDATVKIAGNDVTRGKDWKERLKLSDYGNIVRRLIKANNLQSIISFTGALDGDGMRREYLKSNVFVCPSSIENSPNSLGEAQLLGVPVIASYVGGVMDMMKGDEDHLYRFEETDSLARKIVCIFDLQGDIDTEPMRQTALKRHDPKTNVRELMTIYKKIIGQRR